MDAGEKKSLADIEKYGCHVIHVLEDEEGPPFSCSVGVQRTSGAPEVIVIGLEQSIAHFVVNEVRAGERFAAGSRYEVFLEGFRGQFEIVTSGHFDDYMGWDKWLYGGKTFEVLQLVYPTTDGIWPWKAGASEWFRERQPLSSDHLRKGGLT